MRTLQTMNSEKYCVLRRQCFSSRHENFKFRKWSLWETAKRFETPFLSVYSQKNDGAGFENVFLKFIQIYGFQTVPQFLTSWQCSVFLQAGRNTAQLAAASSDCVQQKRRPLYGAQYRYWNKNLEYWWVWSHYIDPENDGFFGRPCVT
jgi:hypothetical protein